MRAYFVRLGIACAALLALAGSASALGAWIGGYSSHRAADLSDRQQAYDAIVEPTATFGPTPSQRPAASPAVPAADTPTPARPGADTNTVSTPSGGRDPQSPSSGDPAGGARPAPARQGESTATPRDPAGGTDAVGGVTDGVGEVVGGVNPQLGETVTETGRGVAGAVPDLTP